MLFCNCSYGVMLLIVCQCLENSFACSHSTAENSFGLRRHPRMRRLYTYLIPCIPTYIYTHQQVLCIEFLITTDISKALQSADIQTSHEVPLVSSILENSPPLSASIPTDTYQQRYRSSFVLSYIKYTPTMRCLQKGSIYFCL